MRFKDRAQAGRQLAEALRGYRGKPAVVYALPRGGVVLGAEIARVLNAPLDLIIPRKIGHPTNPEYAIGAVTEEGTAVWNETEIVSIDPRWLEQAVKAELAEAKRRRKLYLGGRPPVDPRGKTAIIVDDGVATGLTMLAAIQDMKKRLPDEIVIAVPVVPRSIARRLEQEAGTLVALNVPAWYLGSVGAYYWHFPQVEDDEVVGFIEDQGLPATD